MDIQQPDRMLKVGDNHRNPKLTSWPLKTSIQWQQNYTDFYETLRVKLILKENVILNVDLEPLRLLLKQTIL